MRFDSIDSLKAEGFVGFKRIGDLFQSCSDVPEERGVYLILYLSKSHPNFINPGVGGSHKGRNPNVSISELESNWVDNTVVLYMGKTESLNRRVSTLMRFGRGKEDPHHCGRNIWQIRDYKDLLLAWRICPDGLDDPVQIESEMIYEFRDNYGRMPFANLQLPTERVRGIGSNQNRSSGHKQESQATNKLVNAHLLEAKCPNCGAENLDDALFCAYCAKPIALMRYSSTRTEAQAAHLSCRNCQHPLYAESKICPFCGQETEMKALPASVQIDEQDTIIIDDEPNRIEGGRLANVDSLELNGKRHKAHKIRKTGIDPIQQEEDILELNGKQHKAHKIRKTDINSGAKYCRKCGKNIKIDSVYCDHCGANLR